MKVGNDIKLENKISELLALSDRTSAEIADEIGVSGATLSAYRQGQARPSFDSLVSMADVFDVSLDYLVFGEDAESGEINPGPVVRYMGESLQESQLRQTQRISLVSNVGRRVTQKLNEEIEEFLSTSATQKLCTETLSNPDVLDLERNSIQTRLLLKSFHYNMLDSQMEIPGKFFTTVVQNLSRGHSYQYLLPAYGDEWSDVIDTFRNLLIDSLHSEATVRNNCEFRVTDAPVMTGCGLYHLDMEELRSDHRELYDFITENEHCLDGWFGYSIAPSQSTHGVMIKDTANLQHFIDVYDKLWENAEPI